MTADIGASPSRRLSSRVDAIEPFYVMEVAKLARAVASGLESPPDWIVREGRTGCSVPHDAPMIYLNIGEPDFSATPAVQAAALACITAGRTGYTPALGLPALRSALSRWYAGRWGLDIAPERIVITAGASAALQLICSALFEPGDEVLMADPSYPCNRHFVSAVGATPRLLPVGPEQRYQLDAAGVRAAWTPQTRGVLLASPSNPTGTSIEPQALRAIAEQVRAQGGSLLVDEIYLGLSYEARFGQSALAISDDIISINSFSKYFAMTGWRLGWLVLPPDLVAPVEKLAQNLYICASSVSQQAALACFEPESIAAYEQRRGEFKRRRDLVVPGLEGLGLRVPVPPDGAFYAWADCSAHHTDSWDFCIEQIHRAHVVLAPGRDFGPSGAQQHLRLSFANALPQIKTALARLEAAMGRA